ncbi:hypothetical protein COY87_01400 [Candidatus Roizmanbacteria bacterium CG_4_10_14_0_8_um_filter_33_9]|uniref:Uncharacterized protein n=1 Tax=Candidatus Roizmanbacteria bacterium CG_4_10_14_0_8_um_filter_33_9 TaxID=1974826 RepID=A0A2M7QK34_9BACT|nr:MAG: hypothetical protein COY87_01400 [Candidatus Roizmanbacteria bacterium CG_4_10_14_0_8_um_filter_33_9]
MNSPQYKIQFGNINMGGAKGGSLMQDTDDSTYTLSSTLGQTAAGQFQSNGYVVKAGFQYIYSKIPFTFSVSNTTVDLGTLLPNTPTTNSIALTVSFGGAGQYVVTAQEESALKTVTGTSSIYEVSCSNDTCCNGGIYTCAENQAKPWTSSSAYGFGYNMKDEDVPSDFIDNTYFRPFPDKSASEVPAVIMQSSNVTLNITPTPNPLPTSAPILTGTPRDITHQSTLTFKANISPLQPAGSYQTVIHFVATPSF